MNKWIFLMFVFCIFSATGCLMAKNVSAREYFKGEQRRFVEAVCRGDEIGAATALKGGAQLNGVGEHGMTPLIFAILSNSRKGVDYLCSRGANPDARLSDGHSAVSVAALTDDSYFIQKILENGGDPNIVNPKRGHPPLFDAIEGLNFECARALVAYGADLDFQDRDGNTALKLAVVANQYKIAYLLIESGANVLLKNNFGKSALDSMRNYRGDPNNEMHSWRLKCLEFLHKKGIDV